MIVNGVWSNFSGEGVGSWNWRDIPPWPLTSEVLHPKLVTSFGKCKAGDIVGVTGILKCSWFDLGVAGEMLIGDVGETGSTGDILFCSWPNDCYPVNRILVKKGKGLCQTQTLVAAL